ncbi:hypothetical protein ACRAWF_06040 [Streptomyces sp. L7]
MAPVGIGEPRSGCSRTGPADSPRSPRSRIPYGPTGNAPGLRPAVSTRPDSACCKQELLTHVDGRRTARDLAFRTGRGVYPVTAEVARMLAEGLLECSDTPVPIPVRVPPEGPVLRRREPAPAPAVHRARRAHHAAPPESGGQRHHRISSPKRAGRAGKGSSACGTEPRNDPDEQIRSVLGELSKWITKP